MEYKEKTKIISIGGIEEFSDFRIVFDFPVYKFGYKPCSHAIKSKIVNSLTGKKESVFIVPRVVRAGNEGGYNCTEVCADCIKENL